jgi:hypothetical protein
MIKIVPLLLKKEMAGIIKRPPAKSAGGLFKIKITNA